MNTRLVSFSRLASAVALALVVASCGCGSEDSTAGTSANVGAGVGVGAGSKLRVFVTDGPFPFQFVESASVVIKEVRVHEQGADAWTTVFTGSREIDLVPLQNGVAELLVESDVPPGTFDMVRLIVDAGEVVLTDEAIVQGDHTFTTADGDLFFPSGAQTGVKVKIENDIVVTTELSGDLMLDFDLSRNFVFNGPVAHAPGVRRVIFTPVVRATNVSTAGTIALTVLSDALTPADPADDVPIAGATVDVFAAAADPTIDPPLATVSSDASGMASVSLAPGTYLVRVQADGHEPRLLPDVMVTLANVTDLGDVVLAATGTIAGTVMSDAATPDVADDVAVEGATVEAFAAGTTTLVATATTGADGSFQLTGLEPGSLDLAIHAAGFQDLAVSGVPATAGGVGDTYLLQALTANVTGTVSDPSGAPMEGVTVVAANFAGVQIATATTAADGTYSMVLPTGTYHVTFTSGATVITQDLTVVGSDPPGVQILDAVL